MASVRIDFIKPTDPGLTKLHIYEAGSKDGPFSLIETVTAIGTYPNYISVYTTSAASSATDWFTIAWEDAGGAISDQSIPMQGGTTSAVAQLTKRMMLRDPLLDEAIAAQEAEGVIADYYNVIDPYTINPDTISPNIYSGLTMLALARCYVISILVGSSSTASYTAGLVQQSSGTGAKTQANIENMIKLANKFLGRNYSFIALMDEVAVAGGNFKTLVGVDISRSIIEIA